MDHEVIPCSSTIHDWLLNLSRTTLVYIKKKIVRMTMKLDVPKSPYFSSLHYLSSWSNMVWCERSKWDTLVATVGGSWQRIAVLNSLVLFFLGAKRYYSYEESMEDKKEKVKHEENPQNHPFEKNIFFKINKPTLWCMVTSLGPCFNLHQWGALWHGNNFMVHDVNNPLVMLRCSTLKGNAYPPSSLFLASRQPW